MKTIFSIISVYLVIFLSVALYKIVDFQIILKSPFFNFVIAFAIGVVFFILKLQQGNFYATLKHEFCHWFSSLITLSKPQTLNVHQFGGKYEFSNAPTGVFKNGIISLSPYFFPITTIILVVIKLMVDKMTGHYYILIGISLAFDYVTMYKDYHKYQTDFNLLGVNFSMFLSFIWSIIFLCVVISLIYDDLNGMRTMVIEFKNLSFDAFTYFKNNIKKLI